MTTLSEELERIDRRFRNQTLTQAECSAAMNALLLFMNLHGQTLIAALKRAEPAADVAGKPCGNCGFLPETSGPE